MQAMAARRWSEEELLQVSGSKRFAREMAVAAPFDDLDHAIRCARHIWLNQVDVKGWLEGFAAHPPIGTTSSSVSQWSKQEQSTALATASDSTFEELAEWNAKYSDKFGHVFLICASGRSTPEILAELKRRFVNRPIVELDVAANEELKIIELRLAKLFASDDGKKPSVATESHAAASQPNKAGDRISVIGAHLRAVDRAGDKISGGSSLRNRPPITTHVLDISRGCPAPGMEVRLEKWKERIQLPSFSECDPAGWELLGSSVTNSDGRSAALMNTIDVLPSGFYRMSFNTGKYAPSSFFPYVSIVFEVRLGQGSQHFHVPLLFSPFSFSTYRGS